MVLWGVQIKVHYCNLGSFTVYDMYVSDIRTLYLYVKANPVGQSSLNTLIEHNLFPTCS